LREPATASFIDFSIGCCVAGRFDAAQRS
jgi:hypothetical protein